MTIRPKAGQSWFNVGTRMLAASNGFEKLSDCRIFIRQCVWSVGASLSLLNIVYIRLQQFSKLFILQTSVSSRWESSPPFLADEVKWKVRPSANCQKTPRVVVVFLLGCRCQVIWILDLMMNVGNLLGLQLDLFFSTKITTMEGGAKSKPQCLAVARIRKCCCQRRLNALTSKFQHYLKMNRTDSCRSQESDVWGCIHSLWYWIWYDDIW